MNTHVELLLDKKKFKRNIETLKSKTTSSFFCPMVKANAYGVGDLLVVRELLSMGVNTFGVARVEEGLKLRRFFPESQFKILVFHPVLEEHVSFYKASNLTPIIGSFHELEVFVKGQINLPIHLKFDLGMNRFGFNLFQASEVAEALKKESVEVEALCGHFFQGEDWQQSSSQSRESVEELLKIKKEFFPNVEDVHVPNSEALRVGEFDIGIRPGICMYFSPSSDQLENVLKLQAPIVDIRQIAQGEGVSYGALWRAAETTKIAILPIGYADGLSRALSGHISVYSNNKSFPLVGAICMDYCMVDIGPDSQLKIGDRLEFFGDEMAALENWAALLKTIPYEILAGLGTRIKRGSV